MKLAKEQRIKFKNLFIPNKNSFLIVFILLNCRFVFSNEISGNCLVGKEIKLHKTNPNIFYSEYSAQFPDEFKDYTNLQFCRTAKGTWGVNPTLEFCEKLDNNKCLSPKTPGVCMTEYKKCNMGKLVASRFNPELDVFLLAKNTKFVTQNKQGLPISLSAKCDKSKTVSYEERWIKYQCHFEDSLSKSQQVSVLFFEEPRALLSSTGSDGTIGLNSNASGNSIVKMSGSYQYTPSDDSCVQAGINSDMVLKTAPVFSADFKRLTLQYPNTFPLKMVFCNIEKESENLIATNGVKYKDTFISNAISEVPAAKVVAVKPRRVVASKQ